MIKSFDEVLSRVKTAGPKKIAVAAAHDIDVLLAIKDAYEKGLVMPVLVGDAGKVRQLASEIGLETADFPIIDIPDNTGAARKAVELVSSGQADFLMKGIISTADLMRAVLDKEIGLRTGRVISHIAIFEAPGYDRLMLLTDAAMNIAPDLPKKVQIIQNAIEVAHALEIEKPKVAVLAAVEVVNPDMPATLDAEALKKMGENGEFTDAIVAGPFALDNAVSVEAAKHKGIKDPIAGKADILLVPEIVAGNVLYKSLSYFAHAKIAGVIAGARAPIVLTSRADSPETKLLSIACAVLVANRRK